VWAAKEPSGSDQERKPGSAAGAQIERWNQQLEQGGNFRIETGKLWRRWKSWTDQRPQKQNQKRSDHAHLKEENSSTRRRRLQWKIQE
jgi:hypothetical protein